MDPKISRRRLLGLGGLATGGALVAGPVSLVGAATGQPGTVDCHGRHQAGIVTPAPPRLELAAFDLVTTRRDQLAELLREWQRGIGHVTRGEELPGLRPKSKPPADTGEAVGLGAARLTVTIGFGPSLFDSRFGLAAVRPPALADLPSFPGDEIDPARSGGDLVVQACAESRQVALHAVRTLTRIADGAARVRWCQSGFNEAPAHHSRPQTVRNLLGFKDGTANLDATDAPVMQRNVWAASADGVPWMTNGSYLVFRRVRNHLEQWDASALREQEEVIGRHKASGAPLGSAHEFASVDVERLPKTSHIRLANPRSGSRSEAERILRRGYSFHDGVLPATGEADAGLLFLAYQRDPRRQFVPIQLRLAAADALNEYLVHTASGIFAVPPGVRHGDFVGSSLLAAV